MPNTFTSNIARVCSGVKVSWIPPAATHRMLEPLQPADRKKFVELLKVVVDANDQYGRASIRGL
jgi:hypothetical protein